MSAISSRTMQVAEQNGSFTEVDVEIPDPGPGQVRVTVEACGICYSDEIMIANGFPGISFPITVGHEIAGRIESVGPYVEGWQVGDRVAIGWYGGSDGTCDACRDGDPTNCPHLQVPGIAYPGGFADAVLVPAMALARIPDELDPSAAGPLACAGVTVFDPLRRSHAQPGDTVAILGLGGLGHLGVQFAAHMGFAPVAIDRGADKEKLAGDLGAEHYIDSAATDTAQALQDLGGAKVVLATVPNGPAMSSTINGLGRRGELIIIGATPDALDVTAFQLIFGTKSIAGTAAGSALDVERTMRFAADSGVRPWVEEMPLEQAAEAFGKMTSGEARFRMVLTTGN
jgi:D-arabinose 1-dehydrogenase-like Zn-dependent alcohol dehydrogenase